MTSPMASHEQGRPRSSESDVCACTSWLVIVFIRGTNLPVLTRETLQLGVRRAGTKGGRCDASGSRAGRVKANAKRARQ